MLSGLLAGIMLAISVLANPQPASAQVWRQAEKADNSGATYVQLILDGKFIKRPHADVSAPPSLNLTCEPLKHSTFSRPGFQNAALRIGAPLKIAFVEPQEIHGTSYYQKVQVQYRLDDRKEERENWNPGPDKNSASLSKEVLEKFLKAHTVLITLDEDGQGEVEVQFDIPDSTAVGQVCKLPVRKK